MNMTNPPYGVVGGTPWPRRKEQSSDMQLVGVCIVQGKDMASMGLSGYSAGYLEAGVLLCPDSDVSGDACYVPADTARFVTGGTGQQDETKALLLFEDVYGLDQGNQYAAAMLRGVWTNRMRVKGTAPTAAQKARFQRLTEYWNSL